MSEQLKNGGKRTETTLFKKSFICGEMKDNYTKTRSYVHLKVEIKKIDLSKEVIYKYDSHKDIKLKVGNTKRTNNLITIREYKTLSISGDFKDCWGQIKDKLLSKDFRAKDGFYYRKFIRIWDKYHLNDFTSGTLRQEEVLNKWKSRPDGWSYTEDCEYLKSINLYEDRGYKYGSSWLIKELPEEIIEEIKQIIEDIKNE